MQAEWRVVSRAVETHGFIAVAESARLLTRYARRKAAQRTASAPKMRHVVETSPQVALPCLLFRPPPSP